MTIDLIDVLYWTAILLIVYVILLRNHFEVTPMPNAEVKRTPTEHKVVAILSELRIIDELDVTPGASLRDDLQADSLDMVELMMCLEDRFDIEIDDADAEKIKTVDDIYRYLAKRGCK